MRAKLSKLGTVITGNTPAKQESKYRASSDIPFIKPDVINQDGITELQGTNEYISEMARSKARIVEKGVVLVTCIGTIGKICLTGRECAFNQQINAIIPNDKVLPEYLAYCIYYNRPRLIELANAPVVPIINKRQFEDFSVNIEENIAQQGSIVTILKEVNRLIYYHQQQLQKLDELVKARFIELFIGKGYPTKTIDEVSLGKGEYGAQSASIEYDPTRPRYVRITDINDDGTLNDDVVASINPDDDEQYRLEYGDFLFARMGATVGKTFAFIAGNQIFAGYLIRYKLNQKLINPRYLFWYTKLDEYWNWVKLNQSGAAQPGINAKKYGSLRIPVPPVAEQEQFAAFVEQTDKSKVAVQKALDEAQLLFDSLMQKYFG